MTSSKNTLATSRPITTRLGMLNDAVTLAEIGAKTFHDTFAAQNAAEDMRLYLEKTFSFDRLKSEINNPASTFILAQDGNAVAGYAKIKEQENTAELNGERGIEIERIYVLKEYQGRKIGKVLMQTCLDAVRERGFSFVWLGVWEHNHKALAFYEKWGFEKFGSHPFLLGNDLQTDLLMKKKIE